MDRAQRVGDALGKERVALARVPEEHRFLGRRRAELLVGAELVSREIESQAGRESIPGVPLDAAPLAEDVRDEDLATEIRAEDGGGRVALPARGVVDRPLVRVGGRLSRPRRADRGLEVGERDGGRGNRVGIGRDNPNERAVRGGGRTRNARRTRRTPASHSTRNRSTGAPATTASTSERPMPWNR